jgi:hypothetical protein
MNVLKLFRRLHCACCGAILVLHGAVDFLSEHAHFPGSRDPEPYMIAADTNNGNGNLITYRQTFTRPAAQYQHRGDLSEKIQEAGCDELSA